MDQNRGIGTAICDGILAASTPKPVVLYACSRAGKDLGLKGKVEYPRLDITDKGQIQALVDQIKKDQGGVDILINNAGVNLDDNYSLETAKQTLETNYKGTLEVGSSPSDTSIGYARAERLLHRRCADLSYPC